jgi:hypothetical protein
MASLGRHMARSAMCSTRAILLRLLNTISGHRWKQPYVSMKANKLSAATL